MLFSLSKLTPQKLPFESIFMDGVISGVVTPKDERKSNPLNVKQKIKHVIWLPKNKFSYVKMI